MNAARAARGAIALLAWGAVLLQLVLSIRLVQANGRPAVDGLVVVLGYFTVLTNLFVALAFTAAAVGGERSAFGRPAVIGCATASIAMVGIVYHLVLRNLWAPQGAQWLADMLLHYAVPLAVVAHWLAWGRATALRWPLAAAWCAWPLGYLVYALLRGAWLGSYPYPFIDVTALGYAKVLVNSVGLLVAFVAVALAVIGATRAARGSGVTRTLA